MSRKSDNKSKRLKKNAENERRSEARRSHKRQLLDRLGIWKLIKGTTLAEAMLASQSPPVQIAFGDGIQDQSKCDLKAHLSEVIRSCTFNCPFLGDNFACTDYFENIAPMMYCLHHRRCLDSSEQAIQDQARESTIVIESMTFGLAFTALCEDSQAAAIKLSDMSTALFYVDVVLSCDSLQRRVATVVLYRHVQQPTQEIVNEHLKPVVPCGRANERAGKPWLPIAPPGIHWCRWHASVLGIPDLDFQYPIFVQSHVFRQLERRLSVEVCEIANWERHDWLWRSVNLMSEDTKQELVVNKRDGRLSILVPYLFHGYKLGYLTGEVLDDKIVLTTFLFLTMDGTPEGRLLWQRLRLTKHDKEYHELDTLQVLSLSDISSDSTLVSLFDECGCGHLLRMIEDSSKVEFGIRRADEIRKLLVRHTRSE